MNTYRSEKLINLIKYAQNDDNNALNEIVRRYQSKVYKSFSTLSPVDDAHDLTQEVFFKLAKSIKNLKEPKKFNIWLHRIIKNMFNDSLRKKNIFFYNATL